VRGIEGVVVERAGGCVAFTTVSAVPEFDADEEFFPSTVDFRKPAVVVEEPEERQ